MFWFGEAMTATPNFAADAGAEAGRPAAPALSTGPFVLNLCSSTTPMALAQTDIPELRRFTFFVSRRFEEGRERFRLHMGYFATLAEAEEWLGVAREIYPGAWAGETPGRKLRERAAAAAAAQAQHAAGPQSQVQSPGARSPGPRPPAQAVVTSPAPVRVPVVHAAPPVARAAPGVARAAPPVLSPAAIRPRPAPAPAGTATASAPRAAPAAPVQRAGVPAARAAAQAPSPAKDAPAVSAVPAAPRAPVAPSQGTPPGERSRPAAAQAKAGV